MDDKKRVKKVTVKDLKKELAELHNALGEAQESLLSKAVNIGRLQENNIVISNILSSTRKEVEERGVLLAKARDELQRYEEISAPVNACAEAGPPRIPAPLFRIITNGKRYSALKSLNCGETWMPVQEVIRRSATVSVKELSRWTYRGAKRYIRKQYGETAKIEPREWCQV